MKKLVLALIIAFTMMLTGCSSATGTTQDSISSVSSNAETKMPGIPGSQAYDVVIGLENNGIPKPETVSIDDGYRWDAVTAEYSYGVEANKNHEVSYAEFMVLNGEDDNGYLAYCATIPYDTSNKEQVTKWISENIGTDAETEIGDAVFVLSQGTQGPILEIKSIERDSYVKSKIIG